MPYVGLHIYCGGLFTESLGTSLAAMGMAVCNCKQ